VARVAARHDVDPVTLQIVANALASIADEMATTIFRTAHSTVVRDGMDFSAALCDARGETVAQAVSVPFHLGSIPTAMEALLDHYGDRLRPGDVFVMNDPFDGGIHLQDLFVFKPVHLDGELIGFTATTAHHGDVGGRLPGSSACDNTEIFQEGIRLPWLRLYDEGEPVEDVFKIIEANVRIPRMTLGDLGAQVAACSVAERSLQALATRHGTERLARLTDALIDHTERLVRQEIATWPDGTATFTDRLGSDGIEAADVPITARVTIAGDEVTADLTDSAPMVRGSLNSTRSFVQACVYQAVRAALTVDVPNTSGAFRPIHVLTKPGTVAEVVMPGASSMRGVTGFRVLDAVNGALAQLLPDRVAAAGEGGNTLAIFGAERPEGGRYVFYELVVGTWGATPEADGNDGLTNPASLAANTPVEVAESEYPIVIERYGLVPDSGGAGQHRGGLAVERVWRCVTDDTSLIVRSDRAAYPPYGLAGGEAGATSDNVLRRPDGSVEALPAMFSTTIEAGDVYEHRTAGGGGWGDALERDPAAVGADVADGKVSPGAARERYGVVANEDGTIDMKATTALRAERRNGGREG
jgi:N-methylhydantoinase B/oxoprolinase/acetone carboxylase alpha subunit